jgi:aminopeptidase-like protein
MFEKLHFFPILIALLHFAVLANSQNFEKDSIYIYKQIVFLSSETLAGREGGSSYEKHAADNIVSQLKKHKVKPFFTKSYFQQFNFEYDSKSLTSQNIAGFINNKADSTIIIISHYDHIGKGGKLSKSYGKTQIHPGADDNASGVAMNLLLAKKIKKHGNKNYNYLFLFTGAHEIGLYGAKDFLDYLQKSEIKTKLIINIDMVGRLDENTSTLIYETNSDLITQNLLESIPSNLVFQKKENLTGDHSIFSGLGINIFFLSTGIHSDYHRITDTPGKINYQGMIQITNFVLDLTKSL